jgi:DNA polymerase-3 subunit delta'
MEKKLSTSSAPYPWQQEQWQLLLARVKNHTLPHGLLLAGPEGLGKLAFAKQFAQYLFCEKASHVACQHCHDCQLFLAGTHPDFTLLQATAESKNIKIDDVRALVEKNNFSAQRGKYKIVIIEPAEQLNLAAANALLKTLEEPLGQSLFLLVSHQLSALPATLRSRCQSLYFKSPSKMLAVEWLKKLIPDTALIDEALKLAEGAPLRALAYASNAGIEQRSQLIADVLALLNGKTSSVVVAEKWAKFDIEQIVIWLEQWVSDLIRERSAHTKPLFAYLDYLYEIRGQLLKQINRSQPLLLDALFAKLQSTFV